MQRAPWSLWLSSCKISTAALRCSDVKHTALRCTLSSAQSNSDNLMLPALGEVFGNAPSCPSMTAHQSMKTLVLSKSFSTLLKCFWTILIYNQNLNIGLVYLVRTSFLTSSCLHVFMNRMHSPSHSDLTAAADHMTVVSHTHLHVLSDHSPHMHGHTHTCTDKHTCTHTLQVLQLTILLLH